MPDGPKYKWFHNVRRYRAGNGRFVAETTVKDHVDKASRAFSAALLIRTRSLVADFTEDRFYDWSKRLRAELAEFHNGMACVALGGVKAAQAFSSRNAQVWAAVGLAIAEQLRYFDNFMFGIVAGVTPVDNSMAVRAAMYPMAGYGTYENAVRIREVYAAGFNQERRVAALDGNTCVTCSEQALLGWQPIGTLKHIGNSECMSRCRCYFTYREQPVDVEEV